MTYVYAQVERYAEERMYKFYIADTMMATANNTARFAGGMTITKRFFDMIDFGNNGPDHGEHPNAEDIIQKVINNAGLEVKTS